MTLRYSQMSAKTLKEIVSDYHRRAFPGWRMIGNDRLVREKDPVVQQIGFERLRTGEYRPSGCVRVLVAPKSAKLDRFLNIHDRTVYPDQHEAKFDDVVRAIHNEFVPTIDAPLDPENVLNLMISESLDKSGDAMANAALAAYLGKDAVALEWCGQLEELTNKERMPDWQRTQKDFGRNLSKWIKDGISKVELTQVMEHERERLGLK